MSVVYTTTTQRRFWYRCENCGPLLTSGCHLGPPGDGSPAGAGACIYLGSVPTLHYSAQPGPHLQPPPVNTTALASLCVIKTCCLVDQVQACFCLDLANFSHLFSRISLFTSRFSIVEMGKSWRCVSCSPKIEPGSLSFRPSILTTAL